MKQVATSPAGESGKTWYVLLIPAFGLFIVAALWATVFVGLDVAERKAVATELRDTEYLISSFEEHARRTLGEYDRTLQLLKTETERTGKPDLKRLNELGLIRGGDVNAINVVDRSGNVFASNRRLDAPVNLSDRDYFQRHASGDNGLMDISRPVLGRIVGRTVIVLSRRLNAGDGSFAGIVMMSVNPARFADHYLQSGLGERGMLGMFGTDGYYRARRSGKANGDANPAADPLILQRALEMPAGSYVAPSPFDRVVRLVAYRRLPDYPLVVVAAKSQDEALAEFHEHRRVYLGLALAGTLVLIAFFAVLAWVVQRLQGRTRQLRSQRGFLQTLLDNIPVGISVRELREDGSGTYLIWNETNAVMYGAPKEAALGHRVDAVAPPATAARVLEWDREMIASPSVQEVVEVARLTNGVEAHINRVRAPIFDVEDAARYVITVSENITRRRAAEDDLRLASKVFETTADGIVITDRDDRVITVNSAFTALTGFAESDLLGQKIYESRFNPLDPEAAAERMERLRREGRVMAAVKRRHRDGHELDLWLTATIVRDEAGTLVNLVRIFTDISELKNAQRRLEHLANFDELTGLPNRRLFNDRIEQAVLRARRSGQGVALLFLDVDEFKTVNDTWGHDVGDQLLKGVAGRLAHCVRNTDSLCRLGGDEFTVILEGASLREHAIFVAARIKRELARPILAGKHQVQVSASIGIALFPANATTSTELVSRADAAMYVAKAEGGNRYAFFEPPAQDATA